MLDSQGNKIFASLSEDGRGGDITPTYTFIFKNNMIKARYLMKPDYKEKLIDIGRYDTEKIIGIQR